MHSSMRLFGLLALPIVLVGGTCGYLILQKRADVRHRGETVVLTALPAPADPVRTAKLETLPVPGGATGGAMSADDGSDDIADELPPVVDMDKTVVDDLVRKEEPKNGDKAKTGPLKPVAAPAARREPKAVAAEIDRFVGDRLKQEKIAASPRADDAEFLRRAYLDITGIVPALAKTREFLASSAPDKRERLIDELLASHEYGAHFAHYWHELLLKRDSETNRTLPAQDVFVKWMTGRFNRNEPWDATVRAMLTAKGDQTLAGETFFVMANATDGQPSAAKIVGTASALFLGNQLQCAECHIHPNVADWKQTDFWGLAAYFGRTFAKRANPSKVPNQAPGRVVDNGAAPKGKKGANFGPTTKPDGTIAIPDPRNDGKFIGVANAKLFGDDADGAGGEVGRATAADWFTSPKNPYFPRAAANRMWGVFFGKSFLEALDDIQPDSKPSHPELLESLAGELIASKFDIKHLIRCICLSEAYQRSGRTLPENAEDGQFFSHMPMKAITPRSLFESLAVVTAGQIKTPKDGSPDKRGEAAAGFTFFDNREYDESPLEYTLGVPQLLRLMNSQLPPACDFVAKRLTAKQTREQAIEELYLIALARYPTSSETAKLAAFAKSHADSAKGYSAALWVLLNSAEFMNNR